MIRPIDVFLCCFKSQPYAQQKTFRAWQDVAQRAPLTAPLRFWLLAPVSVIGEIRIPPEWAGLSEVMGMDGPLSEFQRGRRIAGETLSESPVYIVADDDCVP